MPPGKGLEEAIVWAFVITPEQWIKHFKRFQFQQFFYFSLAHNLLFRICSQCTPQPHPNSTHRATWECRKYWLIKFTSHDVGYGFKAVRFKDNQNILKIKNVAQNIFKNSFVIFHKK
jgi:hypothetical protein